MRKRKILVLSLVILLTLSLTSCMGGGGAGGSDFDIVKLLGNPIVQVLGVVFIVYWMMHRH